MTPSKKLPVSTPSDLLACVPTLLGFHPEDSVVMVTAGPAGEPVHARVDLPPRRGCGDLVAGLVEDLRDVASRHRVSGVALVLYTGDAALAGEVGSALAAALGSAGVRVAAVLRADGGRWFPHADDGTGCPGASGVRYDLSGHPLTVQAVVDGRVVHSSRLALRRSLDPAPADQLARVHEAVLRHTERLHVLAGGAHRPVDAEALTGHAVAEARWVRARVRRFLDDRRALDADDAGRMLVGIVSVQVRDVAWAQMDPATCRVHVDLWRDLVRRSPVEVLAAPAGLLAFAAWLSGDGALAWCAVDRSRQADPDYRLAALVAHALTAAVPPSTWRPFDDRSLPLLAE